MRKNNTALIVVISGIFIFLLLAVGSLAYAVFVNGSKTSVTKESETGQNLEEAEIKNNTEQKEKKSDEITEKKVTLEDLKKKTPKNTEYSDNLSTRMQPIHRLYTASELDYEDVEMVDQWGSEWDTELNAVYQALMKKLTPNQQEELRAEQRKWIKRRDAELSEKGDNLVNADLFYHLTMDRTHELAELYDKVK